MYADNRTPLMNATEMSIIINNNNKNNNKNNNNNNKNNNNKNNNNNGFPSDCARYWEKTRSE